MSEGLLGLVKAARGFDPERGTRLASYAAWWIRAYLRSYTISNRRIVRGPSTRNARKTMAWLRRTERELARSTGGPPDLDAVARVLGVKTSDVEEARAILGKRDLPYGTAGEDGYVELAAETSSPEAIVSKAEDQRVSLELVSHALSRLDPRARRILQQRHLGQTPSSLAALSEEFGISRERVRQLEVRAKADVRSAIRSRQARSGALSRVA
jgi:RNA polymerase sigma-32 factor